MHKDTNPWVWKGIFVVLILAIGYGIFLSSQRIDYIWRWERLPQYVYHQAEEQFVAPYDSTARLSPDGKSVTLVSDLNSADTTVFQNPEEIMFGDGDLVYEGDTVAVNRHWEMGPILLGLIMTIKISMISIVVAIIIGILVGMARISDNLVLRYFAVTYVEIIRGTPLLVQIFIFYFFIGTVLDLDRFTAGVAALSVFTGAYIAEIVRAGIQSISVGQMEAARSLGMNYFKAMRYIIMPQALKRTLPPMAGQFISLIKDSSLVSVISITDLTKAGREVVSSTFSPFEVWFSIAILYLVLTSGLSYIVHRLERRLAASD
ncbi:MAG: amino acid ABC transporter permease [Gammaproteobacteria bacterium]|nr:amino acid ABC transporter permease [Gammaproteobacteria bacterium]